MASIASLSWILRVVVGGATLTNSAMSLASAIVMPMIKKKGLIKKRFERHCECNANATEVKPA